MKSAKPTGPARSAKPGHFFPPLAVLTVLGFLFSCSSQLPYGASQTAAPAAARGDPEPPPEIAEPLPPQKTIPRPRIRNYKNREYGAALAPWIRTYLDRGIEGLEALGAYQGSYLFVAQVHNANRAVINQWIRNFHAEQDFSRLAAERIRARLERDALERDKGVKPDAFYGPLYEQTIKAAYRTVFWGARKEDDTWIFGGEGESAEYWGFILLSVSREELELQVNRVLNGVKNAVPDKDRQAGREQAAAFNTVTGRFFERF
ncbi:MAG: hypothetical protein LBG84_00170 [Treponema sp.]|nr:hypothetical protein [Treponema sp.]